MLASELNTQKSWLSDGEGRYTNSPLAQGFLVVDASLKLIFANSDAITILTYPGPMSQNLTDIFRTKVGPALANASGSPNGNGHPIMKLKSGRRTYICRAFHLNSNGKGANNTATLLVLERGMSGRVALCRLAQQFRLTHREQQAISLLFQGLANKEIAEMMGVSANTVKSFLRMATVRMGVSSRSGIVTKILDELLSSSNVDAVHLGATERSPHPA